MKKEKKDKKKKIKTDSSVIDNSKDRLIHKRRLLRGKNVRSYSQKDLNEVLGIVS